MVIFDDGFGINPNMFYSSPVDFNHVQAVELQQRVVEKTSEDVWNKKKDPIHKDAPALITQALGISMESTLLPLLRPPISLMKNNR